MLKLDYKFSNSGLEADIDVTSADITGLHYSLFLGDIILEDRKTSFSTDWEWVPLYDFFFALYGIVSKLEDGQLSTFEFTESEATINFERRLSKIYITSSYADGTIEVDVDEFISLTENKLDEAIDDILAKHPVLKDNFAFKTETSKFKKRLYISKLEALAKGEITSREASEWAESEELGYGEHRDAQTREILDSLQLAGALNENGDPLYGKDDYRDWLKVAKDQE